MLLCTGLSLLMEEAEKRWRKKLTDIIKELDLYRHLKSVVNFDLIPVFKIPVYTKFTLIFNSFIFDVAKKKQILINYFLNLK